MSNSDESYFSKCVLFYVRSINKTDEGKGVYVGRCRRVRHESIIGYSVEAQGRAIQESARRLLKRLKVRQAQRRAGASEAYQ